MIDFLFVHFFQLVDVSQTLPAMSKVSGYCVMRDLVLLQVRPHSFAFLSNFSLYFSRSLSLCWVAKNRTSWTCAHLLCVVRRYGAAPDTTWRNAGILKLAMIRTNRQRCTQDEAMVVDIESL